MVVFGYIVANVCETNLSDSGLTESSWRLICFVEARLFVFKILILIVSSMIDLLKRPFVSLWVSIFCIAAPVVGLSHFGVNMRYNNDTYQVVFDKNWQNTAKADSAAQHS